MKTILAWLAARAAEPSTRAGAAAALGVVAGALGQIGASHEAIGAVLVASGLAAVSAMVKADPTVAAAVHQVETVETVVAPIAEQMAPKYASQIAAVDAVVKKMENS